LSRLASQRIRDIQHRLPETQLSRIGRIAVGPPPQLSDLWYCCCVDSLLTGYYITGRREGFAGEPGSDISIEINQRIQTLAADEIRITQDGPTSRLCRDFLGKHAL